MASHTAQLVQSASGASSEATGSRRIFFANFNGLRFLAAFMVVIAHVEGFRSDWGLPNRWSTSSASLVGNLGVTLFFVLSGFLITYLLLAEKERFGRINFRDFYIRRALRIWPLYYAVVLLALFVFPHISFLYYPKATAQVTTHLGGKLLCYGLMLPNAARVLYASVPYLSQSWSIGVEEQFYLLWPWLIAYNRRYVGPLLALALVFTIGIQLPWFVTSPARHWVANTPFWDFTKQFLSMLRMQSMCLGGVAAALLYFRHEAALRVLRARSVQVLAWLLATGFAWRRQEFGPFTFEVYSVLFAVIILNLADEKHSLVALRGSVLDYLGKISYGLYMLHPLAIVSALFVARALGLDPDSLSHKGLVYAVTLALTIGLAVLSYRFLETPFLKYKKAFVKVKSGAKV